jgi:hypothetical protein
MSVRDLMSASDLVARIFAAELGAGPVAASCVRALRVFHGGERLRSGACSGS